MAEIATIARPYAEALFKACAADLEAAAQWVDTLAAIAATPQLQQFANNPNTSSQQVTRSFPVWSSWTCRPRRRTFYAR